MSLPGFRAKAHPQQVTEHPALFETEVPHDDVDDRETDPVLWGALHRRFRFTVDAAAADHNAKLERYWTRETDGLAQSWAGERVWCNPPYSNIRPWVEKANANPVHVPLVVMLLPANRTEQSWWQELVEPHRDGRAYLGPRVEFLPGRLRFIKPGQRVVGANERPPFGCCLLIWGVSS